MPDSINLRTDREPGDYVEARDVNQISQAVNHLAANIGGGGTTDHRDLTNRDALNQHPINAITNLSATLANKSNLDHNHSISGVVGLQAELDNKAEVTHNHNIGDVSNLWETLGGKAEVGHTHTIDDVEYLQFALNNKAEAGHTHDDRYYTESEVDAALAGKANTSHSHPVTDLTATGTPSATTYLRGDGAWATPEGGGGSQGPSHQSILASGNVTLPTEHPVLTIRADDPATLSLPEAPDGTVVTVHVASGWEHITWAEDVAVTGETDTTETWVVLVRAEGEWQALVSASAATAPTSDTGDVTLAVNPNVMHDSPADLRLRRIGSLVSLTGWAYFGPAAGTAARVADIPPGFQPTSQVAEYPHAPTPTARTTVSQTSGVWSLRASRGEGAWGEWEELNVVLLWMTADDWPVA